MNNPTSSYEQYSGQRYPGYLHLHRQPSQSSFRENMENVKALIRGKRQELELNTSKDRLTPDKFSPQSPDTLALWEIGLLVQEEIQYYDLAQKVEEKYFDAEGRYVGPTMDLDKVDLYEKDVLLQTYFFFASELSDLYALNDPVQEYQQPGINEHNMRHVLRVTAQALPLFKFAQDTLEEVSQPEALHLQLDLQDLFVVMMSVMFHDSALGISTRDRHEQVGGEIVKEAFRAERRQDLVNKISEHVVGHRTADFDYDSAKKDVRKAIMVLADELDLSYERPRDTAEYNNEPWAFFNAHTVKSEIVKDSDGQPVWRITHDIQDSQVFRAYKDAINREILQKPKKRQLFETCFTAIFGRGDFRTEWVYAPTPERPRTTDELINQVEQSLTEITFAPNTVSPFHREKEIVRKTGTFPATT